MVLNADFLNWLSGNLSTCKILDQGYFVIAILNLSYALPLGLAKTRYI